MKQKRRKQIEEQLKKIRGEKDNKMENNNILSKGLLLTIATTFVTIGIAKIGENILLGGGLMLVGAIVFVVREYLKKQGYDISSRR